MQANCSKPNLTERLQKVRVIVYHFCGISLGINFIALFFVLGEGNNIKSSKGIGRNRESQWYWYVSGRVWEITQIWTGRGCLWMGEWKGINNNYVPIIRTCVYHIIPYRAFFWGTRFHKWRVKCISADLFRETAPCHALESFIVFNFMDGLRNSRDPSKKVSYFPRLVRLLILFLSFYVV